MINSKGVSPVLDFVENVDVEVEKVQTRLSATRLIPDDSATLSNITEREILLTTLTYGVSSSTVNTIDPWTLFFSNKRVINRINNYRCMFGSKMRIRMCIAASPFAYGRIIIAYMPFPNHDNCTKIGATFTPNAIQLSQKYHVEMSITDGETHIMELPLLWPYDTIDLQASSLQELGLLYVYPLSPLAQANGSTAGISISFFASMEGIELHRPTTVNSSYLVNQSKPMIEIPEHVDVKIASPRDVTVECSCCGLPLVHKKKSFLKKKREVEQLPFENQAEVMKSELGVVSSTLEETASIVDKAVDIPIVGKYAARASDVARAGSKLAQALGYSAPEDLRPITRATLRPVNSLSHAAGLNDFSKLCLDPTQATDIAEAVVGYQDDVGTSATKICEKECIIAKFTWSVSDTLGKMLFNARCTPNLGYWDGATYRYSNPAEFALMPFSKLRFSNCFTFDAVASKMHRGKLLIVYDPSYISSLELNVLHGVVLDLGDSGATCVEVRIPWSQPKAFVDNDLPLSYGISNYSTSTAYTTTSDNSNGVVGVYVLTPLSSTNDVSGLSIEVLVKSKVCEPKFYDPQFSTLANISYINQSKPMTKTSCDVAQNDHSLVDIMHEYGGEVHDDILEILGKPCYYYSNMHDLANTDVTRYNIVSSKCVRPPHPPCRGVMTNTQAIHSVGNNVVTAPLNYYAPAFAMCKGGVKYIANYARRGPAADDLTMYVGKAARSTPMAPTKEVVDYSNPGAYPDTTWNAAAFHSAGGVVNNNGTFGVAKVNPVLAWECPWQHNLRFRIPREVKPLGDFSLYGLSSNTAGTQGYRTFLTVPTTGSNTTFANSFVSEDIYAAKGEDYALYWFQGMPAWTMYAT